MDIAKDKKSPCVVWLTLAGGLLYGLSSGIRASYGVFLGSIAASSGVDYASLSFIVAFGQLLFGLLQPLFGVLAMKRSNAFVLKLGVTMMAAGLFALPFCRSFAGVLAALGFLVSGGTAALSFGVIMGALSPHMSEAAATMASGVIGASSGVLGIVVPPVTQAVRWAAGDIASVAAWGVPVILLLPVVAVVCRSSTEGKKSESASLSVREMLIQALHSRTYLLIMAGFFTCGFHMIIIETHLFSQITSYGFSAATASLAFSVYGAAAMAGSVISGALCARMKMKNVLALLYGSRVLMAGVFLICPKTLAAVYAFAICLGLTGNATVPPTSGLTSREFGPSRLGALLGVLFVAHQVGAFFSAWLGGMCVALTGGYALIWCADMVLCACASACCFAVREPSPQHRWTQYKQHIQKYASRPGHNCPRRLAFSLTLSNVSLICCFQSKFCFCARSPVAAVCVCANRKNGRPHGSPPRTCHELFYPEIGMTMPFIGPAVMRYGVAVCRLLPPACFPSQILADRRSALI